jgi:hypothetical protein
MRAGLSGPPQRRILVLVRETAAAAAVLLVLVSAALGTANSSAASASAPAFAVSVTRLLLEHEFEKTLARLHPAQRELVPYPLWSDCWGRS